MRIVAMLRVRNEARWIAEVVASILPVTEEIVILDDHSTDGTYEIAEAAGAHVICSPFADETNETGDKNFLLSHVRRFYTPDYVLAIDGDELLEPNAADKIRARLRPDLCAYTFPIRYLWNDRAHYRVDGVYGRYQRASLFSLIDQPETLIYRSAYQAKCGFHCGNVPHGLVGSGATIHADILHLGYMHKEDRLRKYEWYNRQDPHNQLEDSYRHMVVGDLFPDDARFLHGGPLKLFSMPPKSVQGHIDAHHKETA